MQCTLSSNRNIDQRRDYIEQQCHEGYMWCHTLYFERSTNKSIFERIEVIQYIKDSKCKEKPDS